MCPAGCNGFTDLKAPYPKARLGPRDAIFNTPVVHALAGLPDTARGYLDQYFTGWLDPTKLKLLDFGILADLLIAYIDDAHTAGDTEALKSLDRRAKTN